MTFIWLDKYNLSEEYSAHLKDSYTFSSRPAFIPRLEFKLFHKNIWLPIYCTTLALLAVIQTSVIPDQVFLSLIFAEWSSIPPSLIDFSSVTYDFPSTNFRFTAPASRARLVQSRSGTGVRSGARGGRRAGQAGSPAAAGWQVYLAPVPGAPVLQMMLRPPSAAPGARSGRAAARQGCRRGWG